MPTSDVPSTSIYLLSSSGSVRYPSARLLNASMKRMTTGKSAPTLALKSKVKALSSIARGPTLSRLQGTLKHFMAAMRRLSLSSASASRHVLRYILYTYIYNINYLYMIIYVCAYPNRTLY